MVIIFHEHIIVWNMKKLQYHNLYDTNVYSPFRVWIVKILSTNIVCSYRKVFYWLNTWKIRAFKLQQLVFDAIFFLVAEFLPRFHFILYVYTYAPIAPTIGIQYNWELYHPSWGNVSSLFSLGNFAMHISCRTKQQINSYMIPITLN